jgi:pyruvate dehydrogenase E2 component (dihydrolipoamide acetyltransferase)
MNVPYEFRLPEDIAEKDTEGFVVNWFKEEGQTVRSGELLLEVQFDKVSMEIDAPVEGVLQRILTPQGEVVKPGQPLCLIQEESEVGKDANGAQSTTEEATAGETPLSVKSTSTNTGTAKAQPGEIRATPAARRLARELGVRLEEVRGSGPGGRITEADVRAFASISSQTTSAGVRRERLSPAQRVTGQRMLESLRNTAQFTLGREVEVTSLVALREKLKRSGSPVTLSDLIHRAVIIALTEHPRLQAVLEGDELILPDGVHLGFAVARGDDLLVPVIREAHRLNLKELAAKRHKLTAAVLEGRIQGEDLNGATFTVSNLGLYGVDFFTPVLNPPQSGILGVGRVTQRAVLERGEIRSASFLTLSLTVDHRVINGAPAAAFLAKLAELLSSPESWVSHV